MKKIILLSSLCIFGFIGLSSSISAQECNQQNLGCINTVDLAADVVTSVKILDNEVSSADIADGTVDAIDLADNAVTSSKILDGTISGTDIASETVTAENIVDGEGSGLNADMLRGFTADDFNKKYENVVIVAKSGGDFTSIQAAIDSLPSPNTSPTLIEVKPGTYVEEIVMKDYIYLKGSGKDVTTIYGLDTIGSVVLFSNVIKSSISGFTITSPSKSGDPNTSGGIIVDASSPIIKFNLFTNHGNGINVMNSSSPVIMENVFIGNLWRGVFNLDPESSPTVIDNMFSDSTREGVFSSGPAIIMGNIIVGQNSHGSGIWAGSSSKVIGNTMTAINDCRATGILLVNFTGVVSGNSISKFGYGIIVAWDSAGGEIRGNVSKDNKYYGVKVRDSSSTRIVNNTITGNGTYDIHVESGSTAHISFNIYDTIDATAGFGMYNVKSDGTAASIQ